MSDDLRIVGVTEVDLVEVVEFATLEEVVRWSRGMIVEVVVQDEYTHDVIVRGPSPAYVVFDTT